MEVWAPVNTDSPDSLFSNPRSQKDSDLINHRLNEVLAFFLLFIFFFFFAFALFPGASTQSVLKDKNAIKNIPCVVGVLAL